MLMLLLSFSPGYYNIQLIVLVLKAATTCFTQFQKVILASSFTLKFFNIYVGSNSILDQVFW